MGKIAACSIIALFSFLFLIIGIELRNYFVSILAGLITFSFFVMIITDQTNHEKSKPLESSNPLPSSPEKPFKLEENIPFTFSTTSPESLNPLRKSPYEIKIEKANEMRDNPTPAEQRMWEILNSSVNPKFPEHAFFSQSLQYGYILDFYCPTLRLAIEVDGSSHNNKRGYDWERQAHLERKGIQIFRANNADVFSNPQGLVVSLCKIIQEKTNEQEHNRNATSAMRNNRSGFRRY